MVLSILKTGWRVALTVLVFCTLWGFQQAHAQQTWYSRNATAGAGNVNWNLNTTWSTTGHGGAAVPPVSLGCPLCQISPGPLDNVIIAAGHQVTYQSTNQPGILLRSVQDLTVNGTLYFGNGNTATTFGVLRDIVVGPAGTIRGGGTGTNTHTFNIGGDMQNNGTFIFGAAPTTTPASTTIAFTGSGQAVTGTSTTTSFYNVVNSGGNVSTTIPFRIVNNLNFTSNGLLQVLDPANITLSSGATITGFNANRYIELDGKATSTSQLIKENSSNAAQWRIVFPVGTPTGGYTPLDLLNGTGNIVNGNPTNGAALAVKPIFNTSIQGQLRRTFRLSVTNNVAAVTLVANARFYYNEDEDVSGGDVIGNYDTNWFLNAGNGSWTAITGTVNNGTAGNQYFTTTGTQPLTTGTYYYTIGTANAYPMTWYSYQTGFWKTWENWTQDPSGTTLVNPLNLPPQPGDQVVILNGFTITADTSNIVLGSTTVQGGAVLDMANTTNNTLGTVSGAGLLRVGSINLPAGTYTNFVTAGTGGTVEYYNTGGNLPTTQLTYNKLWLTNSTNSNITFVTGSDLTVNSDFNITQNSGSGTVTWQINNGTNVRRTLVLSGNVTVSAGGRIRTSAGVTTGTAGHAMTITGNLVNNGSIKFFDENDTQLSDAAYAAGTGTNTVYTRGLKPNTVIVTVTGLTNNSFTLNGQTDFYRLIVNKGTGQQAMLTINSSDVANFRIFGPNNLDYNDTGANAAPNFLNNNDLVLINGTLQLQGSINIPNLVLNGGGGVGGGWPIPQAAALWINGDDVTIQVTSTTDTGDNGRQIYVFGLLRLSKGTINMGYSRGLLGGGSGVFQVEGGTLNAWQLRTTYLGSNNRFAYKQSGGSVNIGVSGQNGPNVNDFPRFALPYPECSFEMSGGALTVANPTTGGATTGGGIMISALTANVNVTGGTVNAQLPSSNTNFIINSTAPFYDLNISKGNTTGSSGVHLANLAFDDTTPAGPYTRNALPLTILNNLSVTGGNALLDCNNNALTIGGSFQIGGGTTYTPDNNITTFNGSGAQTWTLNGTISNLYDVVMQKSAGTLTLGGTGTFPNITDALMLTSGTLADNTKVLTVTGTGKLTNNAVHTSSGTGGIVVNTTGTTTIDGANGIFGNLTIQTNNTVNTAGKQTVTNTLRLVGANSTLNIASFNLTVLGTIASTAGFGNNNNIETSGLQNAGGLTRKATSAADMLFPVGTGDVPYTPITINATATTAGMITVRPVNGAHPNVTTTGQSVQFYWRVTSDGFAGLGTVTHKTYTYGAATVSAASADYRAARYDPTTYSWSYSNGTYNSGTGIGATTIALGAAPYTFNTATAWTNSTVSRLDGEYTAGNPGAFQTVQVFYSRQNGAWNVATTWSNNANRVAAAGGTPCATCPVVIGAEDGSLAHTVSITDAAKSCGSLELNLNAFLDCGTITGHNFGTNVGGGTVSGRGTLRIASAIFPAGDFIEFLSPNGGTVEWYGATKTLPAKGPLPQELNLLNYNNLVINPSNGATITASANDLLVYNNLTKTGLGSFFIDNTASRKLVINGNYDVLQGIFSLRSTFPTDIYLGGTTTIDTDGTFNMSGTGTQTHTITIGGSIVNNGRLQLRATNHVANLIFSGAANASFTGTGSGGTVLNRVTLDKGTSQASVLMFDVGGTVQTLTNNWLTLVDGTFDFNNENSYTLSTAGTAYNIPAAARLKIDKGQVDIINANNNAADLTLAGTLEVTGGIVNINPLANNQNVNNDIEYAAAGTPSIIVSGGALYVNGSIRRPLTTLAGALVYNQSGGTVTVGGRNAAGVTTRGVFEIESNPGSNFTMTGGTLIVSRSSGGSAYADIYINPATSSVLPAATIQIGMNTNTAVTTPLSLNIVPTIGNLAILGTTTKQFVDIRSSKLNLSGTLQINNNTELETNTLDVTIGGDLSILGTGIYNGTIGGGNTTTFNGSGTQTGDLTATSTFQNITIDKAAGVATLNGTASINNLNILRGVLSVSGTLNVNGNIVNNSTQVGNGFIILTGAATTHTITSGGGSFTNLSLGGTVATKTVDVVGNTTINGTLDFTTGGTYRYLNIASNQLVFGNQPNAVSNAGTNRFIRTNGVSSDLGVVRNWPTGSNVTFTYPVGTRTNYTPATFTLNVSTAGRLTVTAVNEQHPTASANGQYILNYYWMVARDNNLVYNNNGTHSYQFPAALVGGGSGTFMGAHLDAINLIGWTRPVGTVTGTNPRILTITGNLTTDVSPTSPKTMPVAGGEYHYTAGTTQTLPNPVQPVYSRFSDAGPGFANPTNAANQAVGANWNLATNWTLDSNGRGTPLSTVPVGRPVVILNGARMNMNTSGQRAFSTRIDGLLYAGTTGSPGGTPTVGHNLGAISGTGTLRTATNTLPAGNYTQFVSAGGGTIEYIAPLTMNNRNTYNHVSVIGTGVLTMTNTDLILNGNMTIGTNTTLDNSANNRDISIAGNWTNNGTFNTGTGSVIFTDANNQTVNTTTTATFYNMGVSKSGGRVTLNTITTVNNALTFTTGYMYASTANPLVLAPAGTWSGASSASFLVGPMRHNVAAGASFEFPSGGFHPSETPSTRYRPARLSSTSAADTWTGEYIANNPSTGGFNPATFNTVNVGDVSIHEYWLISRTGSAASDLTLSYDAGSYKPPSIGVVPNLRVVRWTGTRWDFPPGAASFAQNGSNTTGTVSVTTVTNFSPFTLGSTDTFTPLPLQWLDFTAQRAGTGVALHWVTEKERNASHFEVERSEDGRTFTQIGSVAALNSDGKNDYDFVDKKANMQTRYYYRIRQVDLDLQSTYSNVLTVLEITGEQNAKARWAVTPNPVVDQVTFWQQDDINSGGQLQAVLTTATGVQVFVGTGSLKDLNERVERTMNNVGAGVYILQLSDGNYQEKFRLVHL
jgi:fibronectin-binding autotransporter adhesin